MKRQFRPWDKHQSFLDPTSRNKNDNESDSANTIPFVTIRNQKFYSDRFYINKTIFHDDGNAPDSTSTAHPRYDENDVSSSSSKDSGVEASTGDKHQCCNCRNILFDRSAFIQSYFDDEEIVKEEVSPVTTTGREKRHNNNTTNTTKSPRRLKAVIFGTYTVDDRTLQEEFPNLFIENLSNSNSNNNSVPCLVLYGKRNTLVDSGDDLGKDVKQSKSHQKNHHAVSASSSRDEEEDAADDGNSSTMKNTTNSENDQGVHCHDNDDDTASTEASALATQDEMTVAMCAAPSTTTGTMSIPHVHNDNSIGSNATATSTGTKAFPKTVHFSQITSSWYKDNMNELLASLQSSSTTSKSTFDHLIDLRTGYLLPTVMARRTTVPFGVHHSKYIICFESDGSIVICITTANLTSPQTTDATWIQRFAPNVVPTDRTTNNDSTDGSGSPKTSNDFGRILTNYLQCTMLSTAMNYVTIHWFVRTYLHWKSIRQLERNYNFHTAQIQLVTVIPGEYLTIPANDNSTDNKMMSSAKGKGSIPFLNGQERISNILQQVELSIPLKCRNFLYSDEDQIIVQPTSFGGGWNLMNMAQLIRSYLGINSKNRISNYMNDYHAIRRLDIVWPTNHFVQSTKERIKFHGSRSWNMKLSKTITDRTIPMSNTTETSNGGFLFCSSEAFNNNDLTCLNRMVMFEPSLDQPHVRGKFSLIPHFKSVSRLIGQRTALHTKYPKLPRYEEYFSWFLLTSACLSRGAQGEEILRKSENGDGIDVTVVAYSNFELGVLFNSYLSGGINGTKKGDRIYCWNSKSCSSCYENTTQSVPRLIQLPVPYLLRPSRYVDDEDVAMFSDTPYFHEIPPGTGCEGNMLLTPYGRDLAAKFCH